MNSRSVFMRAWLLLTILLITAHSAFAQEAVLTGTISDSTGAVLPGVTITAVHVASGNNFVAVTDDRGGYRIPVRIGDYRVTAELQGFGSAAKTITLQVGQTA